MITSVINNLPPAMMFFHFNFVYDSFFHYYGEMLSEIILVVTSLAVFLFILSYFKSFIFYASFRAAMYTS